VRDVDWSTVKKLELLSGGPPCQPFGIGGKKAGQADDRDMWPEARLRPDPGCGPGRRRVVQ
jgi:DNA (cytosine-5)-methyltransferase 1